MQRWSPAHLGTAAVSAVGITIALQLAPAGLSASEIGMAIGLGMAANAAATVPRASRTYPSGMTNVRRDAGWAVGPLVGGMVMQHLALAAPLLIGGTLKIFYDLALYRSFRHLRPPEEQVALTTTSLQRGG